MLQLPTENRNKAVTVGTTSVEVSRQISVGQVISRVYTNASSAGQVISLAWGEPAVANSGMVLYPQGSWSETIDVAYIPSSDAVNAIASAAGGVLAVAERQR